MKIKKCKRNKLIAIASICIGIGMLLILSVPWGNYIIAIALIVYGIITLILNC